MSDLKEVEREPWQSFELDYIFSKNNRKKLSDFLTKDGALLLNLIYQLYLDKKKNSKNQCINPEIKFGVDWVREKTGLSTQRQRKALDILEHCELINVDYSKSGRCVEFIEGSQSFYYVFKGYVESLNKPYKNYLGLKHIYDISNETDEDEING